MKINEYGARFSHFSCLDLGEESFESSERPSEAEISGEREISQAASSNELEAYADNGSSAV